MTDATTKDLLVGSDGRRRCSWPGAHEDYLAYHDEEWGRPLADDARLFEKLCLEGFQAGLSWLTILRKRARFREAFEGFDVDRVARFGPRHVERLLADPGIVRHRGKIEAAIENAKRARELRREAGSLAAYFWSFEPAPRRGRLTRADVPAATEASRAMAKDLKRRGFRFFGPTTAYAFMQATGMVNDHLTGCAWRDACESARRAFERPARQDARGDGRTLTGR